MRGAFGISVEKYGFLVAIVALFFMISAFSSSDFISKIGAHGVIGAGCLITLAGGAAMLGFWYWMGFSPSKCARPPTLHKLCRISRSSDGVYY
jgi:protein-S-isoprenylcysteine O-methyltransferase Ste14